MWKDPLTKIIYTVEKEALEEQSQGLVMRMMTKWVNIWERLFPSQACLLFIYNYIFQGECYSNHELLFIYAPDKKYG